MQIWQVRFWTWKFSVARHLWLRRKLWSQICIHRSSRAYLNTFEPPGALLGQCHQTSWWWRFLFPDSGPLAWRWSSRLDYYWQNFSGPPTDEEAAKSSERIYNQQEIISASCSNFWLGNSSLQSDTCLENGWSFEMASSPSTSLALAQHRPR